MSEFANAVRRSAKALQGVADTVTSAYQDTLYDIGVSLVFFTPLDTGQASGNWNVGKTSVSGQISAVRIVGKGEKGAESFKALKDQVKLVKGGEKVIFSNPVDYIGELEDGKSPQAPAGMTTPTLIRVDDIWLANLTKYKII